MAAKRKKILFLTLNVFSATGGIEKVCRIAGRALEDYTTIHDQRLYINALHDKKGSGKDNSYFNDSIIQSFDAGISSFIINSLAKGRTARLVILSHINLLVVGWLIKKINPKVRLVLFAHGIEIWDNLSARRIKMLQACDLILAVSSYTRSVIIEKQYSSPDKVVVLNNCLDPTLPEPDSIIPTQLFAKKYDVSRDDFIILTLSRLSSSERYKGYDKIISALAKSRHEKVKYIIAGKSNAEEKKYLQNLIKEKGLEDVVSMPGFIPEVDIPYLFKLADLYAMPSTKEGFGIVFIEAMHFGLPVLAGNADGSVDALMNGRLGTLVNPHDQQEIEQKLNDIINHTTKNKPDFNLLQSEFSFETYSAKLSKILDNLLSPSCKTNAPKIGALL